jgi:hypothetical protein
MKQNRCPPSVPMFEPNEFRCDFFINRLIPGKGSNVHTMHNIVEKLLSIFSRVHKPKHFHGGQRIYLWSS